MPRPQIVIENPILNAPYVVRAATEATVLPATPVADFEAAPVVTAASNTPAPATSAPTCRCGEGMVLRHRKADGAAF